MRVQQVTPGQQEQVLRAATQELPELRAIRELPVLVATPEPRAMRVLMEISGMHLCLALLLFPAAQAVMAAQAGPEEQAGPAEQQEMAELQVTLEILETQEPTEHAATAGQLVTPDLRATQEPTVYVAMGALQATRATQVMLEPMDPAVPEALGAMQATRVTQVARVLTEAEALGVLRAAAARAARLALLCQSRPHRARQLLGLPMATEQTLVTVARAGILD